MSSIVGARPCFHALFALHTSLLSLKCHERYGTMKKYRTVAPSRGCRNERRTITRLVVEAVVAAYHLPSRRCPNAAAGASSSLLLSLLLLLLVPLTAIVAVPVPVARRETVAVVGVVAEAVVVAVAVAVGLAAAGHFFHVRRKKTPDDRAIFVTLISNFPWMHHTRDDEFRKYYFRKLSDIMWDTEQPTSNTQQRCRRVKTSHSWMTIWLVAPYPCTHLEAATSAAAARFAYLSYLRAASLLRRCWSPSCSW